MSSVRRPRQSGLTVFWNLLAALERTTQLEANAIQMRDFESMRVLHEAKLEDFQRLVSLGKRLGLTRQNPDLASRLIALERAELRNADAAGLVAQVYRRELAELIAGNHRLQSLKKAYVSDTSEAEFNAEG